MQENNSRIFTDRALSYIIFVIGGPKHGQNSSIRDSNPLSSSV